jgi:molecular chaperone DnaJ
MSTTRDYYDVLGLNRGCSQDEVKKAFRRMARECHPDINKDPGAEARFKEINEAYEILGDPDKRRMYDQFGKAGPQGFGTGGFGSGMGGFENFGFEDIFETFFGVNMGRSSARRGPQRGADLRYEMSLTFDEAVFGCTKEIEIARWAECPTCKGAGAEPGSQPERCPKCNGSGEIRYAQQSLFGQIVNVAACDRCGGQGKIITQPCHECQGKGKTRQQHPVSVTIPAGVDESRQIRLSGQGEMGNQGGGYGNLYVQLRIAPHKVFKRQGDDLVCETTINYAQAALGDLIEVPTIDGPTTQVRVPSGTQHGTVFKVKEKGVPHLGSHGRGDQHVRVKVAVPTKLSDEQRHLLEQLAQSFGSTITPQDGKGFFDKVRDAFGAEKA